MLTTCPIDGAKLIQHQSHRWPCMERGGCACPVVESCPECRARAIRAAEEGLGPPLESERRRSQGFKALGAALKTKPETSRKAWWWGVREP